MKLYLHVPLFFSHSSWAQGQIYIKKEEKLYELNHIKEVRHIDNIKQNKLL
jgi:hypothetical protein